ncbi:MAG: SGNH/GDSL hydrolase family protein [Flavobacteriales bacterium]|nr:SGNH/GDSL hydrolase family protein [Flavobacteriales bacterium]
MRQLFYSLLLGFSLTVSFYAQEIQWHPDSAVKVSTLRDSVAKVITRFEKQILQFEKMDSLSFPPVGSYLFTGSSSIRGWKTLTNDFSGYPVFARGFGGATFVELLYYLPRIVLKYKPSRLFVYCGENDMTLDYSLPEDVLLSFVELDSIMKKELPQTRVYYISIKPCPKSWYYWPKIQIANKQVKEYIEKDKSGRLYYIDITHTLFNSEGILDKNLFLKDGIHITSTVYKKWAEVILPYLN